MELSLDDMFHIATLCRVAMTEEELEQMRSQLSNILGHFEALQELDVEGVTPTGHLGAIGTVLREDSTGTSLAKEDVLGSLEVNKWADFIVLDRDYLTVPENEIEDLRVLMTVVGGKIVHLVPSLGRETGMEPTGAQVKLQGAAAGW